MAYENIFLEGGQGGMTGGAQYGMDYNQLLQERLKPIDMVAPQGPTAEDLLIQQNAQNEPGAVENKGILSTAAAEAPTTGPPTAPAEPGGFAAFHEDAMKQLKGAFTAEGVGKFLQSGVLAKMAVPFLGGKETIGGQVAGLIGGVQGTQAMNEAEKKLAAQELAGGTGFQEGPAGGKSRGLSGLDVLGLSPEQVTGLYERATKLREAERQFPLTATKAYADAYHSYQSGDLAGVTAATKRFELDMESAPESIKMAMTGKYLNLMKAKSELQTAELSREKLGVEILGEKDRQDLTRRFGAEKAGAEIERIKAETGQAKEAVAKSEWGRSDVGMNKMAQYSIMEKRQGQPFHYIPAGDQVIIYDPVSRKIIDKIAIGVSPDIAARAGTKDVETLLKTFNPAASVTGSRYLQIAEKDIVGRLGVEKGAAEIARMRQMFGQSIISGQADPWIIAGYLSPENRKKFEGDFDALRATLAIGGGPSTQQPATAQPAPVAKPGEAFTGQPAANQPAAKPGAMEKLRNQVRVRPGAADEQVYLDKLKGKPDGVYTANVGPKDGPKVQKTVTLKEGKVYVSP